MQINPALTGKFTFSLTLEGGGTPPLRHSTSILKELFDSTQRLLPMNRPRIALNQGRIAFKPAVNLHPWFVSARSQFLLFGKHREQAADVSSFHELHIVKDRPSVRLGGLIATLFYRFLFAIASKKCTRVGLQRGKAKRGRSVAAVLVWLIASC